MDNISRREELEEVKKQKRKQVEEKNKVRVVVPYVQGITERVTRSLKKRKISVAATPHLTLRDILVHPKDKVDLGKGVYSIPCKNCPKQHIGEAREI